MLRKIKSFIGLNGRGKSSSTLVALLVGLLLLFALFQLGVKKVAQKLAPSPSKAINAITEILQSAGYSSRMASFWVGVSDFETGQWTSPLYVNSFNMFGMKQPKKRETLSIGATTSGFARFDSIEDSVRDLVLYMEEFNYPNDFPNLQAMISFMKSKGYFEESEDFYYKGVLSRL